MASIRLFTNYFENIGYICKCVVSGTRGLKDLARDTPKLVLVDTILPDYSGYEICKQIKANFEIHRFIY